MPERTDTESGKVLAFRHRRIGDEIPRRQEPPEGPERRMRVRTLVVTALGVAGCLAIGAYNFKSPEPLPVTGSFSTARGEHRCDHTPDGSEVCLNSGTVLRWVFDGFVRHFELLSGEASFKVHPESRPLEVGSHGLLTRDIHTEFDVHITKSGSIVVTALEGGVKLLARSAQASESAWKSAPIIRRLEQVEFDEGTTTLHNHRLLSERDLAQFMAWRLGEVDLTGKALSDALQELSRYQPTDETFAFQDKEIRQLRVGGRVESTHMDDFLDWLERKHGIQHKRTSGPHGETVITLSRQRNTDAHRQPK